MKKIFVLSCLTLGLFTNITKASSECGLDGSVSERILDCNYEFLSPDKNYILVTRSEESGEVYLEKSTNLLWSDKLPEHMDQDEAIEACSSRTFSGIPEGYWRLPTIEEYKTAHEKGINDLPNMTNHFWSSSREDGGSQIYGWAYNSLLQFADPAIKVNRAIPAKVRCVTPLQVVILINW